MQSSRKEEIEGFLQSLTPEEKKELRVYLSTVVPHPLEDEWDIDADTILTAIQRSSDLTRRGVRGIIAEAVFERDVMPQLLGTGWKPEKIEGDLSYDALVSSGEKRARIQVKLQRLEKGKPKIFYEKYYGQEFYVVEVQKTRSGERTVEEAVAGTGERIERTQTATEETRPYRFSDFDILAVNMHPSSGDWANFHYTLGRWLLPREHNPALIEIMQPVAKEPTAAWTSDLHECLRWLDSDEKGSVLPERKHPNGRRGKNKRGKKKTKKKGQGAKRKAKTLF